MLDVNFVRVDTWWLVFSASHSHIIQCVTHTCGEIGKGCIRYSTHYFFLLFLILFLHTYAEVNAVFCIVYALMRNQRVIEKRFAKKRRDAGNYFEIIYELH